MIHFSSFSHVVPEISIRSKPLYLTLIDGMYIIVYFLALGVVFHFSCVKHTLPSGHSYHILSEAFKPQLIGCWCGSWMRFMLRHAPLISVISLSWAIVRITRISNLLKLYLKYYKYLTEPEPLDKYLLHRFNIKTMGQYVDILMLLLLAQYCEY